MVGIFSEIDLGVFWVNFIVMVVMDNFYFSFFIKLTWNFLELESESGDFFLAKY